jgi:hypothetical protein
MDRCGCELQVTAASVHHGSPLSERSSVRIAPFSILITNDAAIGDADCRAGLISARADACISFFRAE